MTTSALDTLDRDGVVAFRDLFASEDVTRAHGEVESLCQAHLERRGDALGEQLNWPATLYLIDIHGKCPSLDAMAERILTAPATREVLERTLGKHYKLRGYNVRRMHGNHDPLVGTPYALPHEWHRDWPGEFTISVLLTDVAADDAGTAFVPGSHRWPYCPRQSTVLAGENVLKGHATPVLKRAVAACAPFAQLLGRAWLGERRESTGRAGDVFFFTNQLWHGRYPNLHGRNTTVLFIGLFPTEFPFPDRVTVPPEETLAKLPPALQSATRGDRPVNEGKDTLTHRILADQRPATWHSLFGLALIERRAVELLMPLLVGRFGVVTLLAHLRRLASSVKRGTLAALAGGRS